MVGACVAAETAEAAQAAGVALFPPAWLDATLNGAECVELALQLVKLDGPIVAVPEDSTHSRL